MPRRSKVELTKETLNELQMHFFQLITSLNPDETYKFFNEFLTDEEKLMLYKRLALYSCLLQGYTHSSIQKMLGLTHDTTRIYNRMKNEKSEDFKNMVLKIGKIEFPQTVNQPQEETQQEQEAPQEQLETGSANQEWKPQEETQQEQVETAPEENVGQIHTEQQVEAQDTTLQENIEPENAQENAEREQTPQETTPNEGENQEKTAQENESQEEKQEEPQKKKGFGRFFGF